MLDWGADQWDQWLLKLYSSLLVVVIVQQQQKKRMNRIKSDERIENKNLIKSHWWWDDGEIEVHY